MQETGETLELRVSGAVRLGNLIAYDTNSGSTWLQETGEALEGPLRGKSLRTLDQAQWKERVRWDEWKKAHPGTLVLKCSHCED